MNTNTKKSGVLSDLWKAIQRLADAEPIEKDSSLDSCGDVADETTIKDLKQTIKSTDEMGKDAAEFLVTADRIKKEMFNIDKVIHANTDAAMREYYRKIKLEKNKDDKDKEINK